MSKLEGPGISTSQILKSIPNNCRAAPHQNCGTTVEEPGFSPASGDLLFGLQPLWCERTGYAEVAGQVGGAAYDGRGRRGGSVALLRRSLPWTSRRGASNLWVESKTRSSLDGPTRRHDRGLSFRPGSERSDAQWRNLLSSSPHNRAVVLRQRSPRLCRGLPSKDLSNPVAAVNSSTDLRLRVAESSPCAHA